MSSEKIKNNTSDIITMESSAFQDLIKKINVVYDYVAVQLEKYREKEDRQWVDAYDVCQYLRISDRTLQRRIAEGKIPFTKWGNRNYFTIRDIKCAIENKIIKTTEQHLQDLIDNHNSYFHER